MLRQTEDILAKGIAELRPTRLTDCLLRNQGNQGNGERSSILIQRPIVSRTLDVVHPRPSADASRQHLDAIDNILKPHQ